MNLFRTKFSKILIVSILSTLLSSCGSDPASSPQAKMLIANAWKYDVNANLGKGQENLEESTSIKSDIELKGDVKKMADFAAETLIFAKDKKDPSKLSYKKQLGEGILSLSVLGYWEISQDGKTLTLKEWDSKAGKEKEPVNYTIEEISAEQLVLVKEGESTKRIYKKK